MRHLYQICYYETFDYLIIESTGSLLLLGNLVLADIKILDPYLMLTLVATDAKVVDCCKEKITRKL